VGSYPQHAEELRSIFNHTGTMKLKFRGILQPMVSLHPDSGEADLSPSSVLRTSGYMNNTSLHIKFAGNSVFQRLPASGL
jgi:hypothetical protein